jgi:bifunctional DNA-binding transcriptional regulator/antitoxin component of YhaV-PrlF toxin-antitoxin module
VILTLDSKRRLTVPTALAQTAPGDAFEAIYDEEEDEILLRRIKRGKRSWIEVMEACPVPMDDLPPRSRELPKKLKL